MLAFGKQTGIQVMTSGGTLAFHASSGLHGRELPAHALEKLLAGSGLVAQFVDASTVVIRQEPRRASSPATSIKPAAVLPRQENLEPVQLKRIEVLGSLIPRVEVETASPVVVITAEDMRQRGFATVADALQQSSFATAATAYTTNSGDLWGAKTIGIFGLDPSFTKYLIDGRPMAGFSQPAINTNSTNLVNNLTTIPIDIVERIEILPGSQSSLYGSDAIAGVINIITKKYYRGASLDLRYGGYSDGGGQNRKLSFSDMIHSGPFQLSFGAQLTSVAPVFAYQRAVTAQNFAAGISPQRATPVMSAMSLQTGRQQLLSPTGCAGLASLWGGTVVAAGTAAVPYCGSVRSNSGVNLSNKDKSASLSTHASYTFSPRFQLYSDALATYEEQIQTSLPSWSGVIVDGGDEYYLSRSFAPEEVGGDAYQKQYETNASWALGGKGSFGEGWNYDLSVNLGLDRMAVREGGPVADAVTGSYGSQVAGSGLGTGSPDYDLLYSALTPAEYARIARFATVHAATDDDVVRAMLTQTSLFSLPAGDVGLAAVMEGGYQAWRYMPEEAFLDGTLNNLYIQPSHGHRTRWATAAELSIPLLKTLTLDTSARYDSYDSAGNTSGDFTYGIGLEFRPLDSLLLRAKYSTGFKAPSLVDQFQGGSSQKQYVTDYANCMTVSHSINNCAVRYMDTYASVNNISNPNLKPVTTRAFSYGVVWSPSADISFNVDYQQLVIHNEVLTESSGYVLKTEQQCRAGILDISSPSCVAALEQVERAPAIAGSGVLGNVLSVDTTKINLAREFNNALNAGFNYRLNLRRWGSLALNGAYTLILKHQQQTFPGDPTLDLLDNPAQAQAVEFRRKANASLTWSRGPWTATFYTVYYGSTPNYAAMTQGYGAPYAARLPPWVISNINLGYQATRRLYLSFQLNNIKNSMPPFDVSQNSAGNFPYNTGNYNVFGREYFIEARYQFGLASSH
ncbi:TonB-dependent receptor [Frateuria aurantia]